MKATISFTIDDETDADIARWLMSQRKGKRSDAIRDAIRAGWNAQSGGGVERKLDEILRKLENGVMIGGGNSVKDEPERAANALDRLGL